MIGAQAEFFFGDPQGWDELDDSFEHIDDGLDSCGDDLSEDEEDGGDPVSRIHTINLKERLAAGGEDIAGKVKATLKFTASQKINLPIFLDALSWGDVGCHSDRVIQYARTSLLVSKLNTLWTSGVYVSPLTAAALSPIFLKRSACDVELKVCLLSI